MWVIATDFGQEVVLFQVLLLAVAGLGGVGFATYYAYRAWSLGTALGTFAGLMLVNLVPYLGPIVVAIVAKYLCNWALGDLMDEVE